MKFYPTYIAHRVEQLTPDLLERWGIEALILDVDNTLTTHNNPAITPGVAQWLQALRSQGIGLVILSNNSGERVKRFAALVGLPCIARGNKPLTGGFKRCQRLLGVPRERIAIVGDQLFTDIWGGNRYGCKTILVDAIETEDSLFFRCKRALERRLLARPQKPC